MFVRPPTTPKTHTSSAIGNRTSTCSPRPRSSPNSSFRKASRSKTPPSLAFAVLISFSHERNLNDFTTPSTLLVPTSPSSARKPSGRSPPTNTSDSSHQKRTTTRRWWSTPQAIGPHASFKGWRIPKTRAVVLGISFTSTSTRSPCGPTSSKRFSTNPTGTIGRSSCEHISQATRTASTSSNRIPISMNTPPSGGIGIGSQNTTIFSTCVRRLFSISLILIQP